MFTSIHPTLPGPIPQLPILFFSFTFLCCLLLCMYLHHIKSVELKTQPVLSSRQFWGPNSRPQV